MKKQSRTGCLFAGGFFIFLLLVIGGRLFFQALPNVENMVPEAPIIVDIITPDNGLELVIGDFLPIDVKAFSAESPLASFELWVDGQLFAQETTSGNSANAGWVWQAFNQGLHTLFVRVKDSQGRTGQSQVVILNVLQGNGLIQTPAEEGQSLEEIGAQFDIPPDQMSNYNPGIDPSQPLQGGQPVQIPTDGGETGQGFEQGDVQPPNIPTQSPNPPPNPLVFWIGQKFLPTPKSAPLEPKLDIALIDCTNRLYIVPQSDNASGFIVYRNISNVSGFQKIAVLGPGEKGIPIVFDDWITPTGFDSYYYYVSAFNVLGEAPSEIVYQQQGYFSCKPNTPDLKLLQMHWKFQTTQAMDKYYCYQSSGDGFWNRIPSDPFTFFEGQNGEYQQLGPFSGNQENQLQMQCWGWQGGILKYLGQGETKISLSQQPNEVAVVGDGFVVTGIPGFKPKPEKLMGGGQPTVPAPFAMREPENPTDCASHYGNAVAALICDNLMNAPVKEYILLEWEWVPKTCWPVGKCVWINDIDGYYIYEIDPFTNSQKYVKDVNNPDKKATALPLPWGDRCYGVKAYAENLEVGHVVSAMTTFCPDQPPEPQKTVLNPSDWLSVDALLFDLCSTYGAAPVFMPTGGQIVTGSYLTNEPLCFIKRGGASAVKFNMPLIPEKAVIQKAFLRLNLVDTEYEITGIATNENPLCVGSIGTSKQDWTGLSAGHFINVDGDTTNKNLLFGSDYYTPYSSNIVFAASGYSVDVTGMLQKWLKMPNSNHGFILFPSSINEVNGYTCYSLLDNVQLEILYFVSGN